MSPQDADRCGLFPIGGPNPAVNCSPCDLADLDVEAVTAELSPGDLLFIPAWWLHAFRHTGRFNANINFWWKPADRCDNPVQRREASRPNAPHG